MIAPSTVVAVVIAALTVSAFLVAARPLSEAMVRLRAWHLPERLSRRLCEEWLAELHALEGRRVAQLRFAIALLFVRTSALQTGADPRALSPIAVAAGSIAPRLFADSWSRVPALLVDAFLTNTAFRTLHAYLPADPAVAGYALMWCVLTQIVCVVRWGGSPGKLFVGLRVVTADGSPLTWRHAVLREAPYLVMVVIGNLVPAVLLSRFNAYVMPRATVEVGLLLSEGGFLWLLGVVMGTWLATDVVVYIWNGRHRALHDLMAGTAVVHKVTRVVRTSS
jgi:uncharacterized RDD family membrane protein YckC